VRGLEVEKLEVEKSEVEKVGCGWGNQETEIRRQNERLVILGGYGW
jgi:hypothetical protein